MLGNIFNFIAAFITLIVTLLPVFLKFNNENYDKLKIHMNIFIRTIIIGIIFIISSIIIFYSMYYYLKSTYSENISFMILLLFLITSFILCMISYYKRTSCEKYYLAYIQMFYDFRKKKEKKFLDNARKIINNYELFNIESGFNNSIEIINDEQINVKLPQLKKPKKVKIHFYWSIIQYVSWIIFSSNLIIFYLVIDQDISPIASIFIIITTTGTLISMLYKDSLIKESSLPLSYKIIEHHIKRIQIEKLNSKD
ncbi:TPA: hypothetical protein PD270_002688 [Staphylococcus aureus]|nr:MULTISPECIES: hypothetical protein [Staphylococcaceae]EZV49532.1 hypothetical protein V121_02626 [Staphylococcus aureus 2(04HN_17-03-52-05)]KAB70195.1 hypothetical protein W477_02669 [Staphylococcus aureus VET0171R]MBA1397409.1 hypothetical protein [Mammaliicoccus sciuri]MBY0912910.1 hypothetical protein [Staphylococcus aureus]MCD4977350.1 hypothetical protein [Staphylococcus aureus]